MAANALFHEVADPLEFGFADKTCWWQHALLSSACVSVGITIDTIFHYGCSEDEALAALLHLHLMMDIKQYNVVLHELGRIQVGEEYYIGGGPPAALEESDQAQDPEY
ncbi:hypothetical protein C8J57DRAFT_1243308 [Mycena rebaudengoi]|nr:hypothetical protein C8J57DRAFT_1243308 [Mycena rebaudengoi]